jgi:hypothetical protein
MLVTAHREAFAAKETTVNRNRVRFRCVLAAVLLVGAIVGWPDGSESAHASSVSHWLGAPQTKRHDPCLYGPWIVTNYTNFFSSLFGKHFTMQGVTGTQGIRFSKNGEAIVVANHFTITMVANDTHLPWKVSLTGASNATWRTPTRGTVKFSHIEGDYEETISIGGKTGTATPSGAFGSGTQHYVCGKSTLRMYPSPGHPAIVFHRMH